MAARWWLDAAEAIMMNTIKAWYEANRATIREREPLSISIDRLLKRKIIGIESLRESLRAFAILIDIIDDLETFFPALVLPLECSTTMSPEKPNLETLDRQIQYEPPRLYLSLRASSRFLERCEEYKLPLQIPESWEQHLSVRTSGVVYCYYRVFRRLEDATLSWEFTRGIYLEFYPPDLIAH